MALIFCLICGIGAGNKAAGKGRCSKTKFFYGCILNFFSVIHTYALTDTAKPFVEDFSKILQSNSLL